MSLQGDRLFEWDDDKRQSNLAKHDLDFLRVQRVFDGRPTVESTVVRDLEERFVTTAHLDDRMVTVIWTQRNTAIRIISARGARDDEKRAYRAVHGG